MINLQVKTAITLAAVLGMTGLEVIIPEVAISQSLYDSQPLTRQRINSLSHSESPLKWTKTLSQSSLDDFSYETVVLTTGGLLKGVEDLGISQQPPPLLISQSDELEEAERLYQQVEELYNQGKYNEAIPLAERMLAIYKKVWGDEHSSVAYSLTYLALLYENQGRYSEAEPLFLQALEMDKRLLGDEHQYVATSLHNLAYLYRSQGRYKEAEPLFLQALEMRKRLLGDEHPDVAQSLNNLAYLYETQERYTEAEALYRQALEMTKRLLGD